MLRFSVIVPVFNKAPYVEKALQSIISQTYQNYEIVVVDDGSFDESTTIVENILARSTVANLFLRQKNSGAAIARDNGVSCSHGDFLCFLDADDWWKPTFLEEMSKMIEEFPEAGIYGTNYVIVDETKHRTRVAPIGVEPGFEKGYINYCEVYAKTLAMPLWTGAVCIPRSIFEEMSGFPEGIKLGEDFLLWIKIALKYKVAFLNKPLAFYNQDSAPEWRGVGHLTNPTYHMLWHLTSLETKENSNPDYKQLIDNLRTYSLLPYYLSREYRNSARTELNKVDWSRQPKKIRSLYKMPIILLKCRNVILRIGSKVKQTIINHL